jgi:hypothetical protein
MNKKLIISTILVGMLSIGGVAAMTDNDNQVQPSAQEQTNITTTSTIEPIAAEESVAVASENTAEPTTTTQESPVAANEPVSEPFDAQLYAQTKLDERAKQGFAVNATCFNKLMYEAHAWNLTQDEVDTAINKVFTQYSSSCAAYYTFQQTGSY